MSATSGQVLDVPLGFKNAQDNKEFPSKKKQHLREPSALRAKQDHDILEKLEDDSVDTGSLTSSDANEDSMLALDDEDEGGQTFPPSSPFSRSGSDDTPSTPNSTTATGRTFGSSSKTSTPIKCVRFSLELNQIHDHHGPSVHPRLTSPSSDAVVKSVSFCLSDNEEYILPHEEAEYDDGEELTDKSVNWYSAEEIQQFEWRTTEDARTAFVAKAASGHQIVLESCWGSSRVVESSRSKNGEEDVEPYSGNYTPAARGLQQAFEACRQSPSDKLRRNFRHRDVLEAAYEMQLHGRTEEARVALGAETIDPDSNCWLGLEHYLVTPLRGSPLGALRRFMLQQQPSASVQPSHSTVGYRVGTYDLPSDKKKKARNSRASTRLQWGRRPRRTPSPPPPRSTVSNKQKQKHDQQWLLLAHVSTCISRPSRLMAHEIALAHSRAMSL